MNENGKRPYIRVVYVVLLTFFVSILYYGRIYHFGIIPWDGETISLNVVDEAKKNGIKDEFRDYISQESKYISPIRINDFFNSNVNKINVVSRNLIVNNVVNNIINTISHINTLISILFLPFIYILLSILFFSYFKKYYHIEYCFSII